MSDLDDLVAGLASVWTACVWSVGTGTALMAFTPEDAPSRTAGGWRASSGPTSLLLRPGAGVLAFETISSDPRGWNQGIALYGAADAMAPGAGRAEGRIVELDADPEAPIFDLEGDGDVRLRFCPDPEGVAGARRCLGLTHAQALDDLARLPGTWRVETALARIAHHRSEGLPPVHRSGMRPARTTPLPPGGMALAHVFPPHAARARPGQPVAFDPLRHAGFQALLARHGRADLVALKARVTGMLEQGRFLRMALDRHGVAVVRVALRQFLARTGSHPPDDWLRLYDRPLWNSLRDPANAGQDD